MWMEERHGGEFGPLLVWVSFITADICCLQFGSRSGL